MDEGEERMILIAQRDDVGKSKIEFGPRGAKHYHTSSNFSFISKADIKSSLKEGFFSVKGYLGIDGKGEKANISYTFPISEDKEGTRFGCLLFSRDQMRKIRKWAEGK